MKITLMFSMILFFVMGAKLVAVEPYTVQQVVDHTARVSESPFVAPTASGDANLVLGHSQGWVSGPVVPRHPLYGYQITDPAVTDPKQQVVMISGNHNSEHSGSWSLQGAIDFWLSDDSAADHLRRHSVLYVYPMVNPDGRFSGQGRGNPELQFMGITDHNRAWNLSGISTIDVLTLAMQQDTGAAVDYFFDFHSIANGNLFYTLPDLIDSPFARAFATLEPEISPVVSVGHPGMARIWSMSESGLNATYAYTPETDHFFTEQRYQEIGQNYGRALAHIVMPEPASALLLLFGISLRLRRRTRS